MRPFNKTLLDEESFFAPEEMFFSTTDEKGKILFGNDVFVRVSEYREEELFGKPHNIIRHPDMPKAVFKLLWDKILEGNPIVAYVKNRSKIGRYYWVIALVVPFENGFLSIRIKPTSPILEKVKVLYGEAIVFEKTASVEDCLEMMVSRLKDLGFYNYYEFMTKALCEEMKCRLPQNRQYRMDETRALPFELGQIYEACEKLEIEGQDLKEQVKVLKMLSLNMLIGTERYGNSGRAIGVTSENFGSWTEKIEAALNDFIEGLNAFEEYSLKARFRVCVAALQKEMSDVFAASKDSPSAYIDSLQSLAKENEKVALEAIADLHRIYNQFNAVTARLNEQMLALKIVKINAQIESAHLPDSGKLIEATVIGTSDLIAQIENRKDQLNTYVSNIGNILYAISKR